MGLLAEMPIEYLVKEDGERTAVVLRWSDFQTLQAMFPTDPDVLPGLNRSALIALAEGMLAPVRQERLAELLDRNQADALTATEQHELDELLEYLDQMNLIRARALYTLQKLDDTARLAARVRQFRHWPRCSSFLALDPRTPDAAT